MKTWSNTKPSTSQQRWEERYDWGQLKKKKYKQLRPVGPVSSVVKHWVPVIKKDGSKTKFPVVCGSYNPETEQFENDNCPQCRAEIEYSKHYFSNFIDRELQENMPLRGKKDVIRAANNKKKKFREPGDESWSPVRVFKIPTSCAGQLKGIVGLNKHKINGKFTPCELSDTEYGCDVFIKVDPDEPAPTMYDVQKADHSPLTKIERMYKLYNILKETKTDFAKQEAELIAMGLLSMKDARFAKEKDVKKIRDRRQKAGKRGGGGNSDKGFKGKTTVIEEDSEEEEGEAYERDFDKKHKSSKKKTKFKDRDREEYHEKKHGKKKKKSKFHDEEKSIKSKVKSGKGKKSPCFGDYKGKFKCFKCKDRTDCIKET
jgi:hypothetical protein